MRREQFFFNWYTPLVDHYTHPCNKPRDEESTNPSRTGIFRTQRWLSFFLNLQICCCKCLFVINENWFYVSRWLMGYCSRRSTFTNALCIVYMQWRRFLFSDKVTLGYIHSILPRKIKKNTRPFAWDPNCHGRSVQCDAVHQAMFPCCWADQKRGRVPISTLALMNVYWPVPHLATWNVL